MVQLWKRLLLETMNHIPQPLAFGIGKPKAAYSQLCISSSLVEPKEICLRFFIIWRHDVLDSDVDHRGRPRSLAHYPRNEGGGSPITEHGAVVNQREPFRVIYGLDAARREELLVNFRVLRVLGKAARMILDVSAAICTQRQQPA